MQNKTKLAKDIIKKVNTVELNGLEMNPYRMTVDLIDTTRRNIEYTIKNLPNVDYSKNESDYENLINELYCGIRLRLWEAMDNKRLDTICLEFLGQEEDLKEFLKLSNCSKEDYISFVNFNKNILSGSLV